MTVRNAAEKMAKADFCATFGVSEAQLERYFQQGCPHEKNGRRIFVPMPAGRVWLHNYLVEKGKRQAAPTSIDDARRRRAAAEAELAELELAEKRAELMTVSDFTKIVAEGFGRARARLQNLAPRAAAVSFGAQSIPEAQARIEPLVVEVLDELRAADDVPVEPEADEDEALTETAAE